MSDIDYDDLDPGIRDTVRWLNERGFETCDSGDGESKTDMECALPFPNVAIQVEPAQMVAEARRLYAELRAVGVQIEEQGPEEGAPSIQASYDPGNNVAMIMLVGVKLIAPPAPDGGR